MTDKILIVDFGSQVTQLIARRIREAGVYCEIWPFNHVEDRIAAFAPKAFIFSGGPASVMEEGSPMAPKSLYATGLSHSRHLLRRADARASTRRAGRALP